MKKTRNLFFVLAIVIGSFLVSCLSDVDLINFSKDIQLDESLVLPVGSARISVEDLLNRYGLPLHIDTTDSELNYSNYIDHEIKFENYNLKDSVVPFERTYSLLPYAFAFPPGIAIPVPPIEGDLDFTLNHGPNDDRIDKILINSSVINVKVDVSPDLKFIPATDFKIELVFDDSDIHINSGINPNFVPVDYDVTNRVNVGSYTIFMNGREKIPFKLKINISPQSKPVVITPDSYIVFKMSFSDIKTKVVYGFFRMYSNIENTVTLPLDLNSIFPNSHFILANPSLDVTATTNVGVKYNINIDYLKAYNSSNPTNVYQALFYNAANNTSSYSKSETLNGPENLYEWVSKTYDRLDAKTMQTHNFFNLYPYPDKINYHYTITGDSTRQINFITPDSKVKLRVKINIPFSLKEKSYYSVKDTINNFKMPTIPDYVDSAILVLKVKNYFPVQARYRMTFWKSSMPHDTIAGTVREVSDESTISSINSEFIINAPQVDADGKVVETGEKSQLIKIALNKPTLEQLKQIKYITFNLLLEGGKKAGDAISGPMHLTTKNNFEVNLGVFLHNKTTVKPL